MTTEKFVAKPTGIGLNTYYHVEGGSMYIEQINNGGGRWVLFDGDGRVVDSDQFVHDLAERNNIRIDD